MILVFISLTLTVETLLLLVQLDCILTHQVMLGLVRVHQMQSLQLTPTLPGLLQVLLQGFIQVKVKVIARFYKLPQLDTQLLRCNEFNFKHLMMMEVQEEL